jgi:hypothetical protein
MTKAQPSDRGRTDSRRTVEDMNPLMRRKLLQASLAGVSVVGAVGISLGLVGATHASAHAQDTAKQSRTQKDSESHSSQRTATRSRTPSSTPSVSAPQPAAPQATTSGS